MTIGCNIWMICLKLNGFFKSSRKLQFSEFVWALSYSVWDVFNKFLLIDSTDWSKISSDQKRLFFTISSLSFLANTPFKISKWSLICCLNSLYSWVTVDILFHACSSELPRTKRKLELFENKHNVVFLEKLLNDQSIFTPQPEQCL